MQFSKQKIYLNLKNLNILFLVNKNTLLVKKIKINTKTEIVIKMNKNVL